MDQCGSAEYTKNTKAKLVPILIKGWELGIKKIQVLGLLGHLSSYITTFTLNAY